MLYILEVGLRRAAYDTVLSEEVLLVDGTSNADE
jgi:hypothetical protein